MGGKILPVSCHFLFFSIGLCTLAKGEELSAAFYLLPHRMWELLLGCLLATNTMPGSLGGGENNYLKELFSAIGLTLILSSFFLFNPNPETILYTNIVPCLGTALIIYSNSEYLTQTGKFLRLKPISYIGKISYSLYLWHWVLLVFAKYQSLKPLSNAEKLEVLAFVILASMITYHLIEQPFRKKTNPTGAILPFPTSSCIPFDIGCPWLDCGVYKR